MHTCFVPVIKAVGSLTQMCFQDQRLSVDIGQGMALLLITAPVGDVFLVSLSSSMKHFLKEREKGVLCYFQFTDGKGNVIFVRKRYSMAGNAAPIYKGSVGREGSYQRAGRDPWPATAHSSGIEANQQLCTTPSKPCLGCKYPAEFPAHRVGLC